MNEYINIMEKQFIESGSKDDFSNWLKKIEINLERYYVLLKYMDLDFAKSIIELNKGSYNNLAKVIEKNKKIIEISPYADTISSRRAIPIKGKIIVNEIPSIISMKNEKIDFIIKNEIYLMNLPLSMGEKITIEALIAFKKDLYVGIYGSNDDINKQIKLKKLNDLKVRINSFNSNLEIKEENISIYDSYTSIIKIKSKIQ
ncbi:MAG: hypothetical protein PHN42_03775 [Bacilli bacterium]|nr:hypothetical protein [Bacilli bacterium]